MSKVELNALLYSRGLLGRDYQPTLFDVVAVMHEVYDRPPVTVKQFKVNR